MIVKKLSIKIKIKKKKEMQSGIRNQTMDTRCACQILYIRAGSR